MGVRTRTVTMMVATISTLVTAENLLATCSGVTIQYVLAGEFAKNVVSGADKLKLAGGPFSITLYACASVPPTTSGANYATYFPVRLTGSVKSSLLPNPYNIQPTETTLTLAEPVTGPDFITIAGPVDVFGNMINIQGVVALPAGTLTSTGVAAFSSVTSITTQSAFLYAEGTDSTTLGVRGTVFAKIYAAGADQGRPLLYTDSVEIIRARADGTQSIQAMRSAPVEVASSPDVVMLRFYASGVRDASDVRVQIAGQPVPLIYFGQAGHFPGLDEVTIEVPRSLAGIGDADVLLTVDGQPSSPVRIHIQ
jgi:hypothetical protein